MFPSEGTACDELTRGRASTTPFIGKQTRSWKGKGTPVIFSGVESYETRFLTVRDLCVFAPKVRRIFAVVSNFWSPLHPHRSRGNWAIVSFPYTREKKTVK